MARERALRSELRLRSLLCMTDVIITPELYACTVALSWEVAAFVLLATFCRFAAYAALVAIGGLVLVAELADFVPNAAFADLRTDASRWERI